MLKWFSNDESGPNQGAVVAQEGSSSQSMAEMTEQLAQTQQLVTQLKELIREKDNILQTKDEQFKAEKDAYEAKLSKMRLQNRAKVTSLNSQLEDLKKQLSLSEGQDTKSAIKKGSNDGDQEHATASRGKILLLRKKVEELEQQLLQREAELAVKTQELEAQRQRGAEMDTMLAEKNRKLAEKEAYIVDLQMSVGGENSRVGSKSVIEQKVQPEEESSSLQELQLLVQNLTKKVGESEEKYSLLQEQTESLKELLVKEKTQFEEKENMYKQNIQTFKDIILQKDNKLTEINQMHEQELFRLAAKSDASADLEQLLKALKQKLHEKEEVLLGKTQVIDVLQKEVDCRDEQIKELAEKLKRLQNEKDNMQSKLDAEKHVMRAQLRDLMQKHETEMQQATEKHESELSEKEQSLRRQLDELQRSLTASQAQGQPRMAPTDIPVDTDAAQKLLELEAQVKHKTDEASKSESKFLKMKAWSKSRIKQLEDELRKFQSGSTGPDVIALQSRITDLEEERQEILVKLDHYEELKEKNDKLIAKLEVYEEQQRKMQADLEQVTKRAASQTSESGSADDLQSQMLEWQDMLLEAEAARDQAREEKAAMALRMSHIEEEREGLIEDDWFFPGCSDPALASRQQELEEELVQARGLRQEKGKKPVGTAARSLQEDFQFDGKQSYNQPKNTLESTTSAEGENMGGLRSVVEELELERNQLQEQILGLEERCQDLEDRLQLQARIESLQTETERLQAQLSNLRTQQSREAEKHQLLVNSLNEQLKGLSETQECLETSLMEKEQMLAKTSEKLELIDSLKEALKEKETHHKEVAEKLLQAELNLSEVTKKCSAYEKQCSDLQKSITEVTQKLNLLKEKTLKQEATIASLQRDLEQTNDELDKLNSTHLEERAQLIHDLQSCEREIDSLKEIVADKDKELTVLSNNMTEYAEQILELKREIKHKEDDLVHLEAALAKAERESQIIREHQSSDQQALNTKITNLTEQLKTIESELSKAKEQRDLKVKEAEDLTIQFQEDNHTIQKLRGEIQKLSVSHRSHLLECESQISSLKELVAVSSQKLQESENLLSQMKEKNASNEKLKAMLQDKEQIYEKELKTLKEEWIHLLAEAAISTSELTVLTKELEEHKKHKEQDEMVIAEKLEMISLLEQKLRCTQEEAESQKVKLNEELEARDSENKRLGEELHGKCEIIAKLESNVKNLDSANEQLKAAFEKKQQELWEQKNLFSDLNVKNSLTLEKIANLQSQVTNLTEENEKLHKETTCKDKAVLELAEERKALQSEISGFELQHSENQKIIKDLLKDKEALTVKADELSKVLEQNKNSLCESLLEKTNECVYLTKLLDESKDRITHLHNQVSFLNTQVDELKVCVTEKEKMVVDHSAQNEMLQRQLGQVQETLSLLQEQDTALKAGLMEKDTLLQQRVVELNSLQNEFLQQKEFWTNLQIDSDSLRRECSQLTQSLDEKEEKLRSKTQECQKYQDELNIANESVHSLRAQLDEVNKTALMQESAHMDMKTKLENYTASNSKLQAQITLCQIEIEGLQNNTEALNEEIHKLQINVEKKEKNLDEQKKLVRDLNERNEITQQQNAENKKIIQALLNEKQELTARIEEINNTVETNKNSLSENLLEKTNECTHLTKLLSENRENVEHLQHRIEELKFNIAEKEKMIMDQNAYTVMQQSQLAQLQETVCLLQEQGTALKAGLVEKDKLLQQKEAEISSLRNEILLQKELYSQLQKNMNSATERHMAENSKLREDLSQKQAELQELQNQIQILNEANSQLMTERENEAEEVLRKSQEISDLQSELLNKENCMISLTETLKAVQPEKEHLHMLLEQKTESLNEQEIFIKQLQANLVEEKSQISQKMEVIAELQSQVQVMKQLLQDKEISSKEREKELIQLKDIVVDESELLKTQINSNLETITNLQVEMGSALEKITRLNTEIAEKEAQLKQKVEECTSLRERCSDLEDMTFQLKSKVDSLTLESTTIKETLKEKEQALDERHNTSLAHSEILERNFKAKDIECENLKEQVSAMQESIYKLKENLTAHLSEIAEFREALAEKDSRALEQVKALQDLQKKADEAVLFKTQLMENTELVKKLQRQIEVLSLNCEQLSESVKEKQSIISNLQEKYGAHVEELSEVKKLLSQKNKEVSSLNKLLKDRSSAVKDKESTLDVLQSENALLKGELLNTQACLADLSKQKEDALAAQQTNATALTVEIEWLKEQHLQAATQINALTENLEQRELALYEINSQYTAKVEHEEFLVSEIEKVEKENKMLREEISQSTKDVKQQLDAAISKNEHLRKEIEISVSEKEELDRSYNNQLHILREELQLKHHQHVGNVMEALEKMTTEKEHLQVQVSAKTEEITELKLDMQKMTQTLQESEKEWLSVLDREIKEKNVISEQLMSVEYEIKSKDAEVQALQQDLRNLQVKCADVMAAFQLSSEQLKQKDLEVIELSQQVSESQKHLEEIFSVVNKKENEIVQLTETLKEEEKKSRTLELAKLSCDKDFKELSETMSSRLIALEEEKHSLQTIINQMQENHQTKVKSLPNQVGEITQSFHQKQLELPERQWVSKNENQQLCLLQEQVRHLKEELEISSKQLTEASITQSSFLSEIQKKEDTISCMNIQLSQQKELLAALSQQLKEKDVSVTQVMVSASNEMVRYSEEKNQLLSQLESLENANNSSVKELENVCTQLQESKAQVCLYQKQIQAKDSENKELIEEKDQLQKEHDKLSKEKEFMRKKLQAALVVRKDLLKKIDEYEKQRMEDEKKSMEFSVLQDNLRELSLEANKTDKLESQNNLLKQQIQKKEEEIVELTQIVSGKDVLLEKLSNEMQCLQKKLNEQEASLTSALKLINEKSEVLNHLQASIAEREEAFEHERCEMMMQINSMKEEMRKREDSVKAEVATCLNASLETKNELAMVNQQKALLEKKAHAALVARKETIKKLQENGKKHAQELSDLTEQFNNLFEQHSQQSSKLNAIQAKYNEKVEELESIQNSIPILRDELDSAKRLISEKEEILQSLSTSLAERENQADTSSQNQEQLESLSRKLENIESEMASKDALLKASEESSENISIQLEQTRSELENVHAVVLQKTQMIMRLQEEINMVQEQHNQDMHITEKYIDLQSQFCISQAEVEDLKRAVAENHRQSEDFKTLLKANAQIKEELENAHSIIREKSFQLQAAQNSLEESLLQFCKEREYFKAELEKMEARVKESQVERESNKLHIEKLQKEKDDIMTCLQSCKHEVVMLQSKLCISEKLKEELLQKNIQKDKADLDLHSGEEQLMSYVKELEANIKERDNAFFSSQEVVLEKEKLIMSLEQQLQKEMHLHEVAMEQMKTAVNELQQKSKGVLDPDKAGTQADETRSNEQITKKLQAALISRKEALKENRSLKEQLQTLQSENEEFRNSSHLVYLRQQKEHLESSVSSLSKDKEKLISEVEHILSDNHNLSAACESLKLTIENITQQKQAFSCQLESLKDSQTVELSEWKSKHTELKQEYESLLQAYENVSSEMDKMRQLLELARKEKQDIMLKLLETESGKTRLENQVSEAKEESEKMQLFTESKEQQIQELKEENEKIKSELQEFDKKHKSTVEDLTVKNVKLESEINSLRALSVRLKDKLNELQSDNYNLAEELKISSTLEKLHSESKRDELDLQVKLEEAMDLNCITTSKIEAQKVDLVDKNEMIESLQKEKLNISEKVLQMQKDHEAELDEKDNVAVKLQEVISRNIQEMSNLNEKVRILEDDKFLLQEELENVQEASEKVKNENEYLETLLLKNAERIDELTETVSVLQTQNTKLSTELTKSKEENASCCREKEQQQLKLLREFEEKMRVLQTGSEGSKSMKKELQELLKEKHQEIKQLQHDCIKYQELILNLERSLKSSQSDTQIMDKDMKGMNEKISCYEEKTNHLQAQVISYENQLIEARKEMAQISSEKEELKDELKRKNMESQFKLTEKEKALESVMEQQKAVHEVKLLELQNQIHELQGLKESSIREVMELKKQIDSQDLQIKSLEREADTNLAKLTALSINLDNDDFKREWESIFQKTLQEKDKQLLEQSYVVKRLLEDMGEKDKLINDLQVTSSRLERSLNEYAVANTAQQRQLFVLGASNTELSENVENSNRQINEQKTLMEKLEHDKGLLNTQLIDKEDSASQIQSRLEKVEKLLADSVSQGLLVQTQNDKLKVDLEKQESISLQLKSLIHKKDSEIYLLLSSRDGQMSDYIEQLQKHHRAQVADYEDRLNVLYSDKEKADLKSRQLKNTLKTLQVKLECSLEEKEQLTAKLETFKSSMTSLQTEKEHLMSEYRVLEMQHKSGMREKVCLVKEDVNESKGLKHEIKALLHQMDDLNSENAMLKAQLIRYREDLNQVLSLKDNQLKELLKKQQDSIKTLANQKTSVEHQLREALQDLQKEKETSNSIQAQNSKLGSQVQQLEANILVLKTEKAEMKEGVISELQEAVAAKSAECNDLQQKLLAQKLATDDLRKDMQKLELTSEKSLAEAKEKYNSELSTFEREVDLMRNERETAENRVAELARDLMQTEQLLSEARSQIKSLESQNESLGKAMAALQDDRDQLIADFKVLRNKYDDELRETTASMNKFEKQLNDATSDLKSLTKERYILVQKLSAFESDDTYSQLSKQIDELCCIISEKERELNRLSQENDMYSKQMTAFSGSMASLQDDRDRLIQELAKAKRLFESRQGTSPTATTPVSSEEIISLRRSLDFLQTERDRLTEEVEVLQSKSVELAQLRQRCDELQRALQQTQVYKQCTEMDVYTYQADLTELDSEKHQLLKEQNKTALAEKEHLVDEWKSLSSSRASQLVYPVKENLALLGKESSTEQLSLLLVERSQLQSDLQHCLQETHQRDLRFQQLNAKLLQTLEEKMALSSQLKTVSQTLRDTQQNLGQLQNRCYWLESQGQIVPGQAFQIHTPGATAVEVPPGAPQERNENIDSQPTRELKTRLIKAEQQLDSSQNDVTRLTESLAEERARRESAEEALRLAEDRVKSMNTSVSRTSAREFIIQLESDEEREALIIDPTENIVSRKMKSGVLFCRRWLRGRSLYCSKLLTSRAKSRYLFLAYLLALHIFVFMCLTGAL
ncbi:golgin subfamily B member 1 isoform X2 [Scleropages formosus]|uniref:golgin subfamily B member 1 isoform X2 n=1 Tax=Scleropages formosus TaxID=113540 RepID=UPI0010FACA3E|nr:golgin subfamily B member 1-like isoform X2 [Scleropages formosus]